MRSYPSENWVQLGQWVHDARLRAGLTDFDEWARKVERSVRQLQGLERGEPVGEKTLQNVAAVLRQDFGLIVDILAGTRRDVTIQAPTATATISAEAFDQIQKQLADLQASVAELRGNVEPDDQ